MTVPLADNTPPRSHTPCVHRVSTPSGLEDPTFTPLLEDRVEVSEFGWSTICNIVTTWRNSPIDLVTLHDGTKVTSTHPVRLGTAPGYSAPSALPICAFTPAPSSSSSRKPPLPGLFNRLVNTWRSPDLDVEHTVREPQLPSGSDGSACESSSHLGASFMPSVSPWFSACEVPGVTVS